MIATDLLNEAASIVAGDRQAEYGDPEDNFERIGLLWGIHLNRPVSAEDVAWMMVLLKLARRVTGSPKRDTYVDAAGYVALAGQIGLKGAKDCATCRFNAGSAGRVECMDPEFDVYPKCWEAKE